MASSVVDDDTARAVASGRDTLFGMLRTAQLELQKVFFVFVVGFIGTFYALRLWVWDWLEAMTLSQMDPTTREATKIIVTTPFEVILLQAKIGIVVGILVAIPFLVYLSRRELRERGVWPSVDLARWKLFLLGLLSIALFVGGVAYAYELFFPLMFDFLASQAISVGLEPTYSIVDWTEFLVLLTLSFGLAAQLPLIMSGLTAAGMVQYETFRDKWRYAILGIFGFGALFSPPDPFTQVMWAVPLIALYGFSLGLSKMVTNVKRSRESGAVLDDGRTLRLQALLFGASTLLVFVATAAFVTRGGLFLLYGEGRHYLPEYIRPAEPVGVQAYVDAHGLLGVVLVGLGVAAAFAFAFAAVYTVRVLSRPVHPPVRMGDPSAIDLDTLDAAGVRVAPIDVFVEMSEETALSQASAAIEAGDSEKAQAILDRFDSAADLAGEDADDGTDETTDGTDDASIGADDTPGGNLAPADDPGDDTADPGVVQDTATGMLSAFSGERDEDDIGGYIYDLRFIVDSLRSRLFRIVAVFMLVMVAVFTFLYQGGLGWVKDDFLGRIPEAIRPEEVAVITLHPVEALIFIVKVSVLVGAVAVIPMILYYAWPAMEERAWVSGNRDVIVSWAFAMFGALIGGTLVGYYIIAPGIMSYLVYDAYQAGMVITYRISSFSWLIIFTTVGVGLLATVPVTMWMLYRGGFASYHAMRDRWREVTIASFVAAGMFTPATVLTMFLVGIPVMLAYWFGLAVLWLATIGGRRGRYARPQST